MLRASSICCWGLSSHPMEHWWSLDYLCDFRMYVVVTRHSSVSWGIKFSIFGGTLLILIGIGDVNLNYFVFCLISTAKESFFVDGIVSSPRSLRWSFDRVGRWFWPKVKLCHVELLMHLCLVFAIKDVYILLSCWILNSVWYTFVWFCSILVSAFMGTAIAFACFSGAAMLAKRREYLYLGGLLSSGVSILFWLHFASSIFGGSVAMFQFEVKSSNCADLALLTITFLISNRADCILFVCSLAVFWAFGLCRVHGVRYTRDHRKSSPWRSGLCKARSHTLHWLCCRFRSHPYHHGKLKFCIHMFVLQDYICSQLPNSIYWMCAVEEFGCKGRKEEEEEGLECWT